MENPNLKMETAFASGNVIKPSRSVIRHILRRKFLKLLQFFPENLQRTQKNEQDDFIRYKLYHKELIKVI